MKIVERKRIYLDDLRSLCISKGWYTCGTNEEYDALFNKCRTFNESTVTAEDIATIAKDIISHSNIQNTKENLLHVCFEVNRKCCSTTYDTIVEKFWVDKAYIAREQAKAEHKLFVKEYDAGCDADLYSAMDREEYEEQYKYYSDSGAYSGWITILENFTECGGENDD